MTRPVAPRAPASSLRGPAGWLALWFGCGLVPRAPGTAGTLGALPLYLALRPFGGWAVAAAAALLLGPAVLAAGEVARREGAPDPQRVVVDEVVGVLLALAVAPPTWAGAAAAVVAFRVLDQVKLPPARRLERLPGGWGIVLDDVAAGLQAAAAVGALRLLGVLG